MNQSKYKVISANDCGVISTKSTAATSTRSASGSSSTTGGGNSNNGCASGAGKMRIRAFPSSMDERYVQQIWDLLERAIQEIQRKNNSGLSFEELYRNAYTMVLHKHGERLYNGLRQVITDHLRNVVRVNILASINDNFLEVLNSSWSDHTTAMVMIRDILMYMDRVYVQQQKVDSVYNLGLNLFHDEIIHYGTLGETLRSTLLKMIATERSDEVIDRLAVKNACSMLVLLGTESRPVYATEFENAFLQVSAEYFRTLSQTYLAENNALEYMKKVERCIEEESARTKFYLDMGTDRKLLKVLETEMIEKHIASILDMEGSGIFHMLSSNSTSDLGRLYKIVKRVKSGLTLLSERISVYLRKEGELIVREIGEVESTNSGSNPVYFVQSLMDLKDRFDNFLKSSFEEDSTVKKKVLSDFEYLLNLSPKGPEFLSLFIDEKLKKGVKTLSESEMDIVQSKAIILFRFLQEKDVFESYYKSHLAKRLLMQRSISDDVERAMISKLRSECGCQFTAKLEGMFKDIELSSSLISIFKDFTANCRDTIDISVKVLTSCHWPTPVAPECVLPKSVSLAFDLYKSFYLTKHSGRRLNFNPLLGHADLKAIFYGGTTNVDESSQQESEVTGSNPAPRYREEHKILIVSTFQMCVLLRFNFKAKLTYQDLLTETNIQDKELKRALISLSMAKPSQKILCRKENTDEFSVNDSFTSKLTRIKVQTISSRSEAEPERRELRVKIDDDRKHEVEAAIVRIMKARKQMQHSVLISEVLDQLKHRFRPSPLFIKGRIESLIEREYVKRSEDDMRLYDYVA